MPEQEEPESGPRSLVSLLVEALQRLFADEAIPLAGNIAFRVLFSVFPFLIFLTALAGFFGSQELAEKAVGFLLAVAPKEIIEPIAPEIFSILTIPRSGLLSFGALVTVWSAMAGVDSVRVGLNRAYDMIDSRPFWLLYLQNVIFVIAAAFLMLAVALLIVFAPIMISFVERFVPGLIPASRVYDQLRYPIAIALMLIGLTVAHVALPARWLKLGDVWPGVMLTVVVWVVLAGAYAYYLGHVATFANTYAGLSGLFAAMFFIYLAALVLIFGGEVNRVVVLRRRARQARGKEQPPAVP